MQQPAWKEFIDHVWWFVILRVINDFMITKESFLIINPALQDLHRRAPDQSARPAESQGPALDPPVNSEGA